MIKPLHWVALIWFATGLRAGTEPVRMPDSQADKGRTIYERYCIPCHGPEGRGDGPLASHLEHPAPDFHKPESRNKSDDELLDVIRKGHSGTTMAAWKGLLSEKELRDVLAYIRKLGGRADPGPAG